MTDAVCWHSQTIFDQRDPPADENNRHQRRAGEFQVPVPGKGHKNIRADQKQDRQNTRRHQC